ncbi:PREDICTED: uncharacterized protein LOC109235538 [Nicotiana attenuata]|uniref:uncharacterized protein LOC109235538 n=1 Tax=Nicotiana attenuata TaxID=49451 RepID=UPI000905886E|nr:PREDICTED: uncharacterized protein LOC109235538 [Nicotiana attenuata]
MDAESTTQNFINVAKQGDISPRQMEVGKSVGRGKKKQPRDTTGVQQIRTVDQYRRRLGFEQVVVNVSNKIWIFIDQKYDFDILFNMEQQITLKMVDTDDQKEFIITMVYAKCDAIERIELWDTLYSLASDMSLPWLVGGDFNVIWDEEEKFGGLPVHINEIDDFRHCITTCNLFDLGFMGNEKAEKALSIWSRAAFGDIFKQIASLEEVVKLHETQFELNPTIQNRERLQRVQADLIRVWALEEEFWKQKSGLSWFKDGDRNTKVFHSHMKGKRRKMQLKRIQDRNSLWIKEEEKLAEEAVHFYQ